MANEKVLNTRIQLKYDTLANWNASTFKLKAGELAIVKVGEMKDGSTHENAQYPVLFKVGTGDHTFSQLPYASALAADVYAWAKASDVVLAGKTIQFKNGDTVVKSIALNYITEAEANTLISTALASYSTTEQMKAAIKVEADRAAAAEKTLGERIDAFNLPEGGFASQADFTALKNKVEDEDGALQKANDAYALAGEKLATSDFNTFKTENTAAIGTAKSEAIAAAKTETENQVKALAEGAVADNAAAITGIKNGANINDFAGVESAIGNIVIDTLATGSANGTVAFNGTDVAVKGLGSAAYTDATAYDAAGAAEDVKDYADTTFATIANLDKYSLAYDSTNKEFYLADETGAKQGTGIDAKPFIKDGMLSNVEYNAANNTLTFTWNTEAGISEDTVVLSDILDPYVAVDTDTIDMTIDGVNVSAAVKEGSIAKTHLAKALADELDAKATEADLTLAENRIKDLEDKATTGSVAKADVAETANHLAESAKEEVKAVKVDNAVNAEQLGGKAAADYALKTDAQGYANAAQQAAEGKVTALAEGAVADNAAAIDTINETLNGYGDIVTHDVSEFATSAQGALADSALQKADITTGSANGTIAVDGADVAVKGLGTAAYKAEGDFATAAQGAKADAALQSVEAGTGLKVSAKADNKQTIDIDESVVFVFDCGSATKNID